MDAASRTRLPIATAALFSWVLFLGSPGAAQEPALAASGAWWSRPLILGPVSHASSGDEARLQTAILRSRPGPGARVGDAWWAVPPLTAEGILLLQPHGGEVPSEVWIAFTLHAERGMQVDLVIEGDLQGLALWWNREPLAIPPVPRAFEDGPAWVPVRADGRENLLLLRACPAAQEPRLRLGWPSHQACEPGPRPPAVLRILRARAREEGGHRYVDGLTLPGLNWTDSGRTDALWITDAQGRRLPGTEELGLTVTGLRTFRLGPLPERYAGPLDLRPCGLTAPNGLVYPGLLGPARIHGTQ